MMERYRREHMVWEGVWSSLVSFTVAVTLGVVGRSSSWALTFMLGSVLSFLSLSPLSPPLRSLLSLFLLPLLSELRSPLWRYLFLSVDSHRLLLLQPLALLLSLSALYLSHLSLPRPSPDLLLLAGSSRLQQTLRLLPRAPLLPLLRAGLLGLLAAYLFGWLADLSHVANTSIWEPLVQIFLAALTFAYLWLIPQIRQDYGLMVLKHSGAQTQYSKYLLVSQPLTAYRLLVAPLPVATQAKRNRAHIFLHVLPEVWEELYKKLTEAADKVDRNSVVAVRTLVGVLIEGVEYDSFGVLTSSNSLHKIVDLLLALYVKLTKGKVQPKATYVQQGKTLNVKQGQEYKGLLAFRSSHPIHHQSAFRGALLGEVRQGLYRLCQYFPLMLHSYNPPNHQKLLTSFLNHQE